jgi:6-pyruvoyltetrahydropterin/6-carboxytetrahydropterin synthase
MSGLVEINAEFRFDSAHYFAAHPVGHGYRDMHGHSFRAKVAVQGLPNVASGFVVDFAELEQALAELRARLDHKLLNEVDGLEHPSLEHLSIWIWNELSARFAGLSCVTVHRDSSGQRCSYRGPAA